MQVQNLKIWGSVKSIRPNGEGTDPRIGDEYVKAGYCRVKERMELAGCWRGEIPCKMDHIAECFYSAYKNMGK